MQLAALTSTGDTGEQSQDQAVPVQAVIVVEVWRGSSICVSDRGLNERVAKARWSKTTFKM